MNRDIGGFEIAYHKNGVEFTRESSKSGERNSMVVGLTMMQFTLALQKWIKREGFRWKLDYPRWWDDPPEVCETCDEELEECTCEASEDEDDL